MIKTTYQRPELRDTNDNIIQSGSFGKNTALSNATNDGWIDYTMNDLEALHDSISEVTTATTAKTATSNYAAKVWFSDTSDGARLCKSDDLVYNPSLGRLGVKTIYCSSSTAANLCVDGGYLSLGSGATGRLIITLPYTAGTSTGFRFMRFILHIFGWYGRGHATYVIGGGCRQSNFQWSATDVNVLESNSSNYGNLPVYFGNDGTNPYIAIGNENTVWDYDKILITDLVGSSVAAPFSMTISDATLQNVDVTKYFTSVTEPYGGISVRNVPYKNRNLGSSITEYQLSEIRGGTFRGINVGDYWYINNNEWYVAAIDYFYNIGQSASIVNKHHVVIVPRRLLYKARMNATNTTEGGYVSSELFEDLTTTALPIIESAFGANNILSMYRRLPSTCTGGAYTANADYTRKLDLLNQAMVHGVCNLGQNIYSNGSQNRQLPLFMFYPNFINVYDTDGTSRYYYWLYDVVSTTQFASVFYNSASASGSNASVTTRGVRPFFCIG